jgi:telomerase reverse transcriptase
MCRTEFLKRKELFHEYLYYIFDSFLIPLIHSHFHVTESNVHKNRLFYFRHDVWRTLSEPSLTALTLLTFEEVSAAKVLRMLAARSLGTSQIRLLPKAKGLRPIVNLRKRVQKQVGGKLVLGRSINSLLGPLFSVLNYEKVRLPMLSYQKLTCAVYLSKQTRLVPVFSRRRAIKAKRASIVT